MRANRFRNRCIKVDLAAPDFWVDADCAADFPDKVMVGASASARPLFDHVHVAATALILAAVHFTFVTQVVLRFF
jgi:hypothetical protein